MIYAIVGHRGVGKTHFLERLKYYYNVRMQSCHVFDLDSEIEQREKRTVSDIFALHGEEYFRDLEQSVLRQLVNECSILSGIKFIALGAGYCKDIPSEVRVLWLRRPTDRLGRIFLDRPRLDNDMTPLAEFMNRFDERNLRYQNIYHQEICISEGWDFVNPIEPILLGLKPAQLNTSMTLLPEHLANATRLEMLLNQISTLGFRFIELRDDLLTLEQIKFLLQKIPNGKVLISFRSQQTSNELLSLSGAYNTDWALELGPSPLAHNFIISLHERKAEESIAEAADRLSKEKAEHYKFAPEVHDFSELWSGHNFYIADAERHSFLPRSKSGRWNWYRSICARNMFLNFLRLGDGSSLDQPTLFEFLRTPSHCRGFAAVLGDPIMHSRTPAEQHDFFYEKDLATCAIQMHEYECDSLSLSILQRLGLVAAAVTAPLKKKIIECCVHVESQALQLGAVNTILVTARGLIGTNTDIDGVAATFTTVDVSGPVAVWGGGGTRKVLRTLLPKAHFYSARRGEEIWIDDDKLLIEQQSSFSPRVVIWAVGRSRMLTSQLPPQHWQPQYVIDLNYSEDSPGREYALVTGAKYISGKGIFKTQARSQRNFWASGGI